MTTTGVVLTLVLTDIYISLRRVDPSVLVFSLSSHRHTHISLLFRSRFILGGYVEVSSCISSVCHGDDKVPG
jgi:hypothetical protein